MTIAAAIVLILGLIIWALLETFAPDHVGR
jgi:hypothetical protein